MFRAIVALLLLAPPAWGHACWEALQVRDSDGAMRIARVWVTRQADADRLDGLGYDRTELSEAECVTEPYPPTPPPPQPPRPQPEPQPSKSAPHDAPKYCRMLGDVAKGDQIVAVNPDRRHPIACSFIHHYPMGLLEHATFNGAPSVIFRLLEPGERWTYAATEDGWLEVLCTVRAPWLSLRTAANATLNSEKCRE